MALLTGCRDTDDNTSGNEGTIEGTPAKSLIGTWYNNINAFSPEDSALTYLSFSDNNKGIYANINEKTGFNDFISFNYSYDNQTGDGSFSIVGDEEIKFSATDDGIAMLDSLDNLGLFSKYSDDALSWNEIFLGWDERNKAKSDIASWMGSQSYNPDILVDLSDVKPTPVSSSAKTRADDGGGMPSWMSSFLGSVAQMLMSYGQNYIANTFYQKGNEDMFCWFTDSKKLNIIYDKISKIQLSQQTFIDASVKGFDTNVYREMNNSFIKWHSNIQDEMGKIDTLALADSIKALSLVEDWVKKDPKNPQEFVAYVQQLVAPEYPYIVSEDDQSKLKTGDVIDFMGQMALVNYAWKTDMYNFYLGYMSALQQLVASGSILTTMYYTYISPNKDQLATLGQAHAAFENHLAQYIQKLKPNPSEVECLIPHCHIVMKRDMNLKDYSKIPADKHDIDVKDLYSYEIATVSGLMSKSSNIAWSLALDSKCSDTAADDTLTNVVDGLLSRSNVDYILKAYENIPKYKGNLIKILLETAGMTFVSNAPVDTTKLCMLTKTSHGYGYSDNTENIPLILPSSDYWSSPSAYVTGSSKIYQELGGYTKNLFALTGYKYNSDSPKAYKIGILNVDEQKTRKWYTLWLKKITDAYTIKGISEVENNLWLVPYVTKRYNKSAAWDY